MPFQVSPGINVSEIDLTTVVPGVATSSAAIAGVFRWGPVGERVLVNSEAVLVDTFGKPTNFNAETFFTAANFLAYSDSLFVVRAANTVNATSGAFNAVANTGSIANIAAFAVKNRDDYDSKTSFSGAAYIAKYPGALGNSLRVSVCDSAAAYTTDLDLVGVAGGNTISGSFNINVGSSVATLTFVTSDDVTQANAYANTILSGISVGDVVKIGNSTLGVQYLSVSAVSAPAVVVGSTTNAAATITFTDTNKLAADFNVSNTVNGNTTVANITRSWKYFDLVDAAPGRSDYVAQYGNTAANDLLHVVVIDQDGQFSGVAGNVLEVFQNLSRATDAKSAEGASIYYKNAINQNSRYVWWAADRTNAASATAAAVASSTNVLPLQLDFISGWDGNGEATVEITTLASGYDLFKSSEVVDVSLILAGKPRGGASNTQVANYLIDNIATTRKDCVVFVSPDDAAVVANPGNEATALVNWRNNVRDTSYAFIDSGYKYQYDRYNDVYRYVPLNGDIAGLTARTEYTNDAWWSPAGFNRGQVKNIVKLRYNPTKADRDLIYKNAVNPVVSFTGQGTILFGDKTATSKPSAFDRLNVRRLFIVLEKSISEAAKFSLFEFNDSFTRSQFRNLVIPFLRDVQSRRGITDFLVVCDETNNTPERIDRNEFWGDIYVKPNRSINFIQLNFVAVRTGVEFSTIIGANQ